MLSYANPPSALASCLTQRHESGIEPLLPLSEKCYCQAAKSIYCIYNRWKDRKKRGNYQGRERVSPSGHLDLQGQLAPSGVLDDVLPSGQQPNSPLSQDERSSAVGAVVLASVEPGGDTEGLIIIHEASGPSKFKPAYC